MKHIWMTFILTVYIFQSSISAQVNVNVMTFNIWQEGTSVSNGLIKIKNVIAEANPDIVGFAEVRNYGSDWTTKIVNELSKSGLNYYRGFVGGDVSIISKFPILGSKLVNNQANSISAFLVDLYGDTIIVACGHLDYTYYACYLPRGYNGGYPNWDMINDGSGNPEPVLDTVKILDYNLKAKRDEQIAALFSYLKDKTYPVIFMGDFNEPSYLDWTKNTGSMFDHHDLVIPWQTTLTLSDSGFTDAYRSYFPNAVDNPGITWPSFAHGVASTSWTPKSDERDRIDFIFYKGDGIQVSYASLVGPKESYSHNVLTTSNTENENFIADTLDWPSDHKAVFVTLTFENITDIKESNNTIIENKYNLNNNYPNPFNPSTKISYSINFSYFEKNWKSNNKSISEFVILKVFDMLGNQVQTLVSEEKFPGNYEIMFDGRNYASGVYLYTLQIGNYSDVKKMMLLK